MIRRQVLDVEGWDVGTRCHVYDYLGATSTSGEGQLKLWVKSF